MRQLAAEAPFQITSLGAGSHRITCPECSEGRKKRTERCLSVTVDRGEWRWFCHNCNWAGVHSNKTEPYRMTPTPFPTTEVFLSAVEDAVDVVGPKTLSDAALGWLARRAISASTAEAEGVFSSVYGFPGNGRHEGVWFPYIDEKGKPYAHKIRTGDSKLFVQAGGAGTFWRSEKIEPEKDLYIVEGEMDALSLVEVGEGNVVSVPNGAPLKVSDGKITPEEDKRFKYVWSGKDILANASRIIIAVDNDEPGKALGEELARRIGKARAWRIVWPEGCKDANDVLVKEGVEKLKHCLANPEPWPIAGVYGASHYEQGVRALYTGGLGKGMTTGFTALDDLYTVVPGHLCVITGAPGSGKTTFLNAVMVNMAREHDWRFAIWSTETTPEVQISCLAALYVEKPFFGGGDLPRITDTELDAALEWVNDHFVFLTGDGGSTSPDSVIDRLKTSVLRYGVRGAVVDPASYLARPKADGDGSSDPVGHMLEAFKGFAVSHDVALWLIAHPYKLRPNVDGSTVVPKGYEISGSASWYNRPDFGLTIHRPVEDRRITEVHNWKTRFAWTGSEGKADLHHDRETGRYSDQPFAHQGRKVIFSVLDQGGNKMADPWDLG